MRGGIGVGAFTKIYGGRHRNGTLKRHFKKSSKGLNRHILIALEEMDIVGQKEESKGGRWISQNGQRELDTVAAQIIVARTGGDDDEEDDEE